MEEIYIKSADLDVEDVARESATQTVTLSSPKDSLYKIYRQGDKIHQIRDENVTMVQGGTATQRTSVEPEEQMDEISSGESLFKTFTFNNGITKEETEKCLSFWRSVVEKNLEPIKCSIIENIEKLKGDCDERKKEKCQKKRNIKKPSKLETHSDCATPQKNVWCDIMNELQKKRINETKLLMEKRCRFCGYVNSPPYETEDLEKQTLSMINELSTWQPKSHKRKELLTKKIAGITKENGKGKRLSQKPQWDKNSQEEERSKEQVNEEDKDGVEPDKAEEEEEEKMQKAQDALVKNIKQDSSKLKYVDGIQDKKEQGLDSKWRKNKMEPCKCDRPECDCNISPSIKSVEEVSPDKIKSTLVDYPTNTETAFQVLEEFSSEVEKRLSLSNDVLNIFTKECEEENKGGSCQKVAGSKFFVGN
ncbi:hypothetical protein ABEB36_005912 [Hypothenemus hampei]|uniref:Uncharacterized protein n=1 Tax=Hypothenemus hampei TaxID=57062 RepID=A0ABD1F3P2_HYPHA